MAVIINDAENPFTRYPYQNNTMCTLNIFTVLCVNYTSTKPKKKKNERVLLYTNWTSIKVNEDSCVCVHHVLLLSSLSDEGTENCGPEMLSVQWPAQGTQVPTEPCTNGKFPGQQALVAVAPGFWYMNDGSHLRHKAAGVGRDPGTTFKGETYRRQLSGGC